MFGVVFGWRKASKCKKVIKQAQCRLNLLKKKRDAIVRHLRQDTANLIKIGHPHIALDRAEQLIKDESVAVAYELIDNFCDFIRTHFKYIRRHKDCPDDINEAVSSLIYASARCGDLPELREIRKLFEERYGQKLATAAIELFPGNLVNQQIKEALDVKSVSDDMKHRMVNEIATDYCLQPQLLALEYYPEWQQKMQERSDQLVVVSDVQTSTDEKSDGEIVPIDINMTSTSDMSPTVQRGFRAVSVSKEERIVAADSSENSPKFSEETLLVYLDDIEELQSPKDEDSQSQDQRVFKFKAPILSKKASFRTSVDRRYDYASYESWSEKSSSKSSQRSSGGVSRKRIRRRLVYQESQGLRDTQYPSYYAQPQKSHNKRKQQKKILTEESEGSFCSGEMRITPLESNRRVYPKRPNYFSTDTENDEANNSEASKRGRERLSSSEESNKDMDWAATLRKPSRRSLDRELFGEISNESKGAEDRESGSQHSGRAWFGSCRTRKGAIGSYVRNATMPPERAKTSAKEEFQRSNSCPVQEHPNHVHPKLPDYDDLTATFLALKKEFLTNKLVCSNSQL